MLTRRHPCTVISACDKNHFAKTSMFKRDSSPNAWSPGGALMALMCDDLSPATTSHEQPTLLSWMFNPVCKAIVPRACLRQDSLEFPQVLLMERPACVTHLRQTQDCATQQMRTSRVGLFQADRLTALAYSSAAFYPQQLHKTLLP